MQLSIADALENHSYYIVDISTKTKDRRRLLDMGLTPNTFVSVYKFAPFKSTVLIALRGTIIALRLDTAKNIFVKEGFKNENSSCWKS